MALLFQAAGLWSTLGGFPRTNVVTGFLVGGLLCLLFPAFPYVRRVYRRLNSPPRFGILEDNMAEVWDGPCE